MFEKAARMKLRFDFKGLCSVEDLWDLSVQNLDSIYKKLNSELKQKKEESLLEQKNKEDETLELKIKIIKYIVETKLAEKKEAMEYKERIEKKKKIMSIIAEKQDEKLKNLPLDELEKTLAEL